MGIIGGIWLVVTVLVIYLFISANLTAAEKIKRKHPTARIEKGLLGERIYGYLITLIMTVTPILNLLTLFILVTQYDDIVEKTISKVEDRIISEE